MTRNRTCALLLLSWSLFLPGCGDDAGRRGILGGPEPPELAASLGSTATVRPGSRIEFEVRASDPDGDRVSLTLLNPPPLCQCVPVRARPGSAAITVRWQVSEPTGGLVHLVFLARDSAVPANTSTLEVVVRVQGPSLESLVLTGDVTGDGLLDVIAAAPRADIAGVVDAGALYVWAGAAPPAGVPTAVLAVPGGAASDLLGTGVPAAQDQESSSSGT